MRKHQQKQVLELIKTMNEAYAEIKRLFSLKDYDAVIQLLSECQDFAVKIGSYIESFEGEGTRTVALLEDCHEALYQAGRQINGETPDGSPIKRLREMFLKIESSVHNELKPDKIEVVFLPYNAAMWDSLESIYLAARDDPHCDAYVVPVPYFDRMPDGTMGQMHYEGDRYPAYVSITDWQAYDIEARHPDIIFIHNPYDGGNHVTIIHPEYYSKRLKEFTDLLVYVPYFVSVDDVQEHFCVCSGTMHAGKVIVQSEKIRQTYIRAFKKFEKENHCAGAFGKVEDKFVALGSPKFDKVIYSKPEDFTLPDEWRQLIDRSDGSKKKTEAYLNKIRFVLDTFRKRDDAVLWWRPHPLNKAAYQSMRPQLADEYELIVSEYQREGFGIYDDTPDLHRALCLTSCYYGDWSSLVAMYQCTGKPVMIQNVDMIKQNDTQLSLAFEKLYDDGNDLWFTAFEFNALFKLDKRTLKAEFVGEIPDEKDESSRLYYSMVQLQGQLYLAPLRALEMAVYDLNRQEFKKRSIVDDVWWKEHQSEQFRLATVIAQYKEHIFLAGGYPAIIRYNTQSGQVDYFDDWLIKVRSLSFDGNAIFFRGSAVGRDQRFLVLACIAANASVVFDMETCTSMVIGFGPEKEGFNCACYDGRDFWFVRTHSPSVVKWNLETGAYKELTGFPPGFVGTANSLHNFNEAVFAGGHVWLIPSAANMALKIDPRDNSISIARPFQEECGHVFSDGDFLDVNYICARQDDRFLYAFTGKTKKLIRYECATGLITEAEVALPDAAIDYFSPIWAERKAAQSVRVVNAYLNECEQATDSNYYEYVHCSLSDLITFLVHSADSQVSRKISAMQEDYFHKSIPNHDGSSGMYIFRYCSQLIHSKECVQ
jgi:hypothetical protein